MKNVVVVDVTNLAYGIADDPIDGDDRFQVCALGQIGNGNFAADDDDVAFGVGFAGDPAMFIAGQAGIENGIGNRVANLIGVAFANRFGGKNEATRHGSENVIREELQD